MERAWEWAEGRHLVETVSAACAYCLQSNKCIFFSRQNILTVFCVNTSSSDFVQDHVLGTTWKAAFHTAKYINRPDD